jgi:hypothetical protein
VSGGLESVSDASGSINCPAGSATC